MKTILKTSIAATAAIFALTGIAAPSAAGAEDVRISLTGKDAKTIHAEIVQAAYKVCKAGAEDAIIISAQSECVADTIAKAEDDVKRQGDFRFAKAEITAPQRGER